MASLFLSSKCVASRDAAQAYGDQAGDMQSFDNGPLSQPPKQSNKHADKDCSQHNQCFEVRR